MGISVNEQLKVLYETHYGELKNKIGELLGNDIIKATNPLLIRIDDEETYQSSDLKIMFFG